VTKNNNICDVCEQQGACDKTIHRLLEDGILDEWFKMKLKTVDKRNGLPRKVFFWTISQISDILMVSKKNLIKNYIWREGYSKYAFKKKYIKAINISNCNTPKWRIEEQELVRWLRFRKIKIWGK